MNTTDGDPQGQKNQTDDINTTNIPDGDSQALRNQTYGNNSVNLTNGTTLFPFTDGDRRVL